MNKDILAQKEADVIALSEKMEAASSIVLVEYRGLSVKEVTELRRALREENVEFKVYRNAIARRAAEKLGHEDFAKTLVGPNALAFGKDPVAPARVLAKFAKNHEALVLKTGIVDGAMVDEATIQKLSALPNKEGMLAKFAKNHEALVLKTGIVDGAMVDEATIQKLSALPNKEGMLAKFASCLNAPVIKFAMTVKALAEAKENGSVKTEEAPATEEAAA